MVGCHGAVSSVRHLCLSPCNRSGSGLDVRDATAVLRQWVSLLLCPLLRRPRLLVKCCLPGLVLSVFLSYASVWSQSLGLGCQESYYGLCVNDIAGPGRLCPGFPTTTGRNSPSV